MKILVWFRQDLRLRDNPALHYAASQGDILPVFIYPQGLGGASYWWLHQSLIALMSDLKELGVELILKTGDADKVLAGLCKDAGIQQLVWNRVYSPQGIDEGLVVKNALKKVVHIESFNGQLLIEPTKVLNKQGLPFKVFTPFWRHCVSQMNPSKLLEVPEISALEHKLTSDSLEAWGMCPQAPDWSAGLAERWQPGESGAQHRWDIFLENTVSKYKEGRDFPNQDNTSYLSPHLTFGEISAKQLWFDMQEAVANREVDSDNGNKFLAEIGWREFSRYLIVHFPHIISQPFNSKFADFPWDDNKKLLTAWQRGKTGYPIVDAGMRELYHTGYMHNRVRMVAASFLTKHCLTHWQYGADWFWDTLVDADIASNTASWQWVSGCGVDAAPYFRVFNPVLQGEKFDKQGEYIKKWVPELAQLPIKFINKPWECDPITLQLAGIEMGETYPLPIVEHKEARNKALNAYQSIRKV